MGIPLLVLILKPMFEIGDKVKFVKSNKEAVNWGTNVDPDKHLIKGNTYEVTGVDIHAWHTKITLKGFENYVFNSVHFELVG